MSNILGYSKPVNHLGWFVVLAGRAESFTANVRVDVCGAHTLHRRRRNSLTRKEWASPTRENT